ncbi:hypothetical protein E2562_021268 [Oryza meyeriana var. granulata]|uniref:Uncharacterized protein n=1 Tax=Oryza meyeriana var. granulata TaxID=110450 RepID=A0A6G1BYI8_9ORYZ|nr:hypothetical protein E2562_021268 [Oryza meyeriana var. granulata]
MAMPAVEALGLGPAVWTPLHPGFLYDPARFRSMTEEGFVYDPVFRFGTEEGFHYDERGFRVEAEEEDVADDIASFCARVELLQGEAGALASRRVGGDVETGEVASDDDDDALEEGFSHVIDLAEELLE